MEKNGFRGVQHILTQEDRIKGGQSKSLYKTLANQHNPLSNRKTITKKIAEKMDGQGGDINALKGLLKLSSTEGGQALMDTMIDTLVHMKEIVDDKPTIAKYDTFMKNLVLFKTAVWGTKIEIKSNENDKLLNEFKEKLLVVEKY